MHTIEVIPEAASGVRQPRATGEGGFVISGVPGGADPVDLGATLDRADRKSAIKRSITYA